MRLLLDTHAWLWYFLGDGRLSGPARRALDDPANERFLSITSCWELAIKVSTDKYRLNVPFSEFVERGTTGVGISLLATEPRHLALLTTLPFHHRDPFDRLILAQSLSDNFKLVSNDGRFGPYGTDLIW